VVKVLAAPTKEHLQEILKWLKEEKQSTGEGFYCNRRVISKAFHEGRFHCLFGSELAVAFIVLDIYGNESEISILEVHPAHRGCGFGTLLVKHSISYLKERGVNIVDVECTPPQSESFWRGRGFTDYNPPFGSSGTVYLRLAIS